MTWFEYDQNNSGGKFLPPAIKIVVEAADSSAALVVAQANGLNLDAPFCRCCGERWSDYSREHADKPPLGGNGSLFGEYADISIYKERAGVPRAIYVHASGEVEVVP